MNGITVSDSQQFSSTGPHSHDSSNTNWKERSQERWASVLGKMYALGQLVGWESIRRGMAHEDELSYRHALANEASLHGKRVHRPEPEEMGDIILGDRIEQHYETQRGMGSLAKAGIAAALIGSGAGLSLALPLLVDALADHTKPQSPPPAEVIIEPGTDRDWKLGTPIVE